MWESAGTMARPPENSHPSFTIAGFGNSIQKNTAPFGFPTLPMSSPAGPGDITITGGIESDADNLEKIVQEVAAMKQTERGNRSDDKRSETAMEDRKRQGYF